ncbi:MAG TPA: MYG1 family protein [Candidatus Paceibacterota bacterium]|nr:MYG1 family protein [Candidatus Paceibacterota bacterium]HMP19164.1 MYG1 family protein [Candidatus Paceibacterota bacterium]HMP85215.1 MYG1 family protein [Candidatus Paceibacterota bacterium]
MKKILTHNGRFHADDCFAVATLQIYFEKIGEPIEVIRSRDSILIKSADFVLDVGGIYDSETNRFDHHQSGGAGKRENGVPYSAFGLVWKHYGSKICKSQKVANMIDSDMIECIDSVDNGYEPFESLKGISNFSVDDFIKTLNPNRLEQKKGDDENMPFFNEAVAMCKRILERQIKKFEIVVEDEIEVEKIYSETEDKRIIIFDKSISWQTVLCKKPEPLYVVHTKYGEDYAVTAVPVVAGSYTMRKPFPKSWCGKIGADLAKVSLVPNANFCHANGFLCNATDKESALQLAQKALENNE